MRFHNAFPVAVCVLEGIFMVVYISYVIRTTRRRSELIKGIIEANSYRDKRNSSE